MKQYYTASKVEFAQEDNTAKIVGYIPYFNPADTGTEYKVNSHIKTRFAPNAFDKALASGEAIRALYNHDSSSAVGTTANGSLVFTKFDTYLRYSLTLDLQDPDAVRMLAKIRNGTVSGTSFGGVIESEVWSDEDEYSVQTVNEFNLVEVSPTPNPAFTSSRIVTRADDARDIIDSYNKWQTIKRYERLLKLKA